MKGFIWNYFHASNPNDDGCKIEDKIDTLPGSIILALAPILTYTFYTFSMSVHTIVLICSRFQSCSAPKAHVISTLTFRTHDYGKTHRVYKRGLIQETST